MRKYRAGIYLRLSKEHTEDNNSIEAQREITTNYASKNGYQIIKEYVDNGYSGILDSRPALNQMLQDITRGLINMVIVKDISRLTRNKNKTGWYTEIFFPEQDVRFISVTELIDTGTRYEIDDTIMLRGIANQYYIADISKKIRANKQAMKKQGKYVESAVCYGYKKAKQDKYKVVVDQKVAKNVKLIYQMYEQGKTGTQIANYLNQNKVLTPSQYRKSKHAGRVWHAETVLAILSNPFYIGNTIMNRYHCDYLKKTCKKNAKEKWLIKEHTHKAIITKEQYNQVQEIKISRTSKKKKTYEYLLKGLLYCGECKHKLLYKEGKKRSGFVCSMAYKQPQPCKNRVWLTEQDINEIVVEQVKKKLVILKEEELIKRMNKKEGKTKEEKEIQKRERKKKVLYKQRCEGEISVEEFKKEYDRINQEIEQAERNIKQTKKVFTKEDVQKKMIEKLENKNDVLIKALINRVEWDSNRKIKIIFK